MSTHFEFEKIGDSSWNVLSPSLPGDIPWHFSEYNGEGFARYQNDENQEYQVVVVDFDTSCFVQNLSFEDRMDHLFTVASERILEGALS